MLNKVKVALRRVTEDSGLTAELLSLIAAAIADLEVTGAYLADKYTVVKNAQDVIVDYNVSNPLLEVAIITYCALHSGEPTNYYQLKASYDEQKAQLRENPDFIGG